MDKMMEKLNSLGCNDQTKIMMARQTYLELCEIDLLWNMDYHYNRDFKTVYITGSKSKSSSVDVYIPVHSSFVTSIKWIEDIRNIVSSSQPKNIILVIRDGDSTSTRYRITSGLIEPTNFLNKFSRNKRKRKIFQMDDVVEKLGAEAEQKTENSNDIPSTSTGTDFGNQLSSNVE